MAELAIMGCKDEQTSKASGKDGKILSAKTLADLKTLLTWVMAEENRLHDQGLTRLNGATRNWELPETTAHSKTAKALKPVVVDQALIQAISRHRLEITLAPHLGGLAWPEAVIKELLLTAQQQRLAALPILSTGIECCRELKKQGIRSLLIKGPALAMQTTGDPTARGVGDLDILVEPGRMPEATSVLETIGFVRIGGQFPRNLHSLAGRYCRWIGYEFSLVRRGIWLDLHWALSNVRSPLPNFEALWVEHQTLTIEGKTVATLSHGHAFLHACAHATKDQWMTLRNLVDIARLAQQVPVGERPQLQRSPAVQLSCAVAYEASRSQSLLNFTKGKRRQVLQAQRAAKWSQLRMPRARSKMPWKPGHWLNGICHSLLLAHSPQDWIRTVCNFLLPPADFNDPSTGKDRHLGTAIKARFKNATAKLNQWRLAANAGETGEGSRP